MNAEQAGRRGGGQGSLIVERVLSISAPEAYESNGGDLPGVTDLKNVSCVTRLSISCFLFLFLFTSYLGPFSHRLNGRSTPGKRETHTTSRENHTVLRESHTIPEVTDEA